MFIRRDYQIETHDALVRDYEAGHNRLMAHLATGLGKTTGVAAFLPEVFPTLADRGVLFLSHRREILYQAYEKFKAKWSPEKWIGIEMGEWHCTGQEDFIFASVDSIGRMMGNRIRKFKHRYPGIIIADEGHHVTPDGTWDNILNFFGVGSDETQWHRFPNGDRPLSLFLTATPKRSDGQSLAPFLDKISVSFDIMYAIRNGWLTDIKAYHAELTNEDYQQFDLERQVDFLIKTWLTWGEGMRTLAFARSVAQSELLSGTLTAKTKYTGAHVDATTAEEIRQELVRRFALPYGATDAVDMLSNRLIFTEGYDNPLIECILDNAPTQSQPLYIQKIGRGLRPDPALDLGAYETAEERREAIRTSRKPYLTYITSFPLNHGLDMPATLFGLPKNIDSHGRVLSEVVDLIEYEEEELPEAPTRDLSGMDELDIRLKRQDIWSQTVYNEELKALSPLRWIVQDNYAALRLPTNPFSKKVWEQTPLLVVFTETEAGWCLHRVLEGGWIESQRRAARAKHENLNFYEQDLNTGIKKIDRWLKVKEPELFQQMHRSHNGPASAKMKEYLKRKKIDANYDALTAETAQILKDFSLIRPKLEQFDLI